MTSDRRDQLPPRETALPARKTRAQDRLIEAAWDQVANIKTTAQPDAGDTGPIQGIGHALAIPVFDGLPSYELQSEIHRGGQGVVYRATQISTGQTVAIKVMLGGVFAGPQQIARFEREVRILAQLDHPNIVTIHDSGVENGVTYYVMDFIDGQPLDEFLRKSNATLREKLERFGAICDAVNTAHLRGVIHRDLKPNNILVDDRGCPRILDFGLAKPIEGMLDHDQAMTETGQFVGSIPWASPEQALGHSDQIDLRTDVYSLGVILYQLLTGDFPYRVQGQLADVVQAIVHDEPRPPCRKIDSDIATVALMALHKEPDRRYQSAGALGQDVKRFLAGEPISARRASVLYLLRRKVKRHKWIAFLAAILLVSLLAGSIVSATFWRIAYVQARETALQAAKAEAVTDFLSQMMQSGNLYADGTADMTVREAVDRAAQRLDEGALADQPATEQALRMIMGGTYDSLGLQTKRREQYERARALMLQLSPGETRDSLQAQLDIGLALRQEGKTAQAEATLAAAFQGVQAHLGADDELVVHALVGQAGVARDRGRFDEAERLLVAALDVIERLPESERGQPIRKELEGIALNELAISLSGVKRYEEAIARQEEAIEIFEEIHGPDHFRTITMVANLARDYANHGQFDDAEQRYQETAAAIRRTGGADHPKLATCLDSLGQMYRSQRRHQEAIEVLEESLNIRKAVLDPKDMMIAYSQNSLATCYFDLGRFDEALEYLYRSLEIIREKRGDKHPDVSSLLTNIAAIEVTRGQYDVGERLLREALEIAVDTWGNDHINIAKLQHNLGKILLDMEQLEEAETLIRGALKIRINHFGEEHLNVATTEDLLSGLLQKQGQLEAAEGLCRKALATRRKLAQDPMLVALNLNNLAGILSQRGDPTSAITFADEAVAITRQVMPKGHWRIAQIAANRAIAKAKLGMFAEAETELVESFCALQAKFGKAHPLVGRLSKELALLYEKSDRTELAEAWRKGTANSPCDARKPSADDGSPSAANHDS